MLEKSPKRLRPEDEAYAEWKKSGDAADLPRLVALLRRHARAVVFSTISPFDPTLPEEIVSRALTREASFRGDSAFSTWFHRLAKNHCFSYLRSRRHTRYEQSIDSLRGADYLALSDGKALASVDYKLLLENLLPHLNSEEKELLLRRLDGEELKEIGECWGLTLPGIKTKWFRLRSKLQKLI